MTLDTTLDVDVGTDSVDFTVVFTNTGDDALELDFRSGHTADFVVTGDGVDWRWSDGQMFTQALRTERLEPGVSLTETATWDTPEVGTYTVTATLEATDRDSTAEASFEV